MKKWCTGAVVELLVKAGEMPPQQMERKDAQWVVMQQQDLQAMKRDLYEDLILRRDPFAKGQTREAWKESVHENHWNYWRARMIFHHDVGFVEAQGVFSMLHRFARTNPTLLMQISSFPLHIVARKPDPTTTRIFYCHKDWDMGTFVDAAQRLLPSLKKEQEEQSLHLKSILAACDSMTLLGRWACVALDPWFFLQRDARLAMRAMKILWRDDRAGVLQGCRIRLSALVGPVARNRVSKALHRLGDGSVCPSVSISLANCEDSWKPALGFQYAVNKMKKCASLENTSRLLLRQFPAISGVQFDEGFSLTRKLHALQKLKGFMMAVTGSQSTRKLPPFQVRIKNSASSCDVVFDATRGLLSVPANFDFPKASAQLQ